MFTVKKLFDLTHTKAEKYLSEYEYPWQALEGIGGFILSLQKELSKTEYTEIKKGVYVHKTAIVSPFASVAAPSIIGKNTEIRHCAFIRGSALIGENCVIGNSTEIKNSILFDSVQVPHFNYIGDSILGYKVHFGAGVITSNVKSDKTPVTVKARENFETGLKKFGAAVGDLSEIGCNTVLNPGSVIGKNSVIYPLVSFRGVLEEGMIYKNKNSIIKKEQ